MNDPIVLAYSGGLDTSFCIPYLKEKYATDVHAVIVDCVGLKRSEKEAIRQRALDLGAAEFACFDGFPSLYDHILSFLIKGNVLRDRTYPLCVGAERYIQAELILEYAKEQGTNRIAHGSTGAGNDQVRFDVALRTAMPDVEIIAPIRDEELTREDTTAFLKEKGFDVPQKTTNYSINDGIWGTSVGGTETITSEKALPFEAFPNLKAPHELDDEPEELTIDFAHGLPVAVNGHQMEASALLEALREFGRYHGIGMGMHLGDTILGIKGRIGFEAPVAKILYTAHRELEKLVLSQEQRQIKDSLADKYGAMLHEANYYDPVMRDIEAFFNSTQARVTGEVTLYACRGSLFPLKAHSPYSAMNNSIAKYGEEAGGWNGSEARAYSKLYSIRTQIYNTRSK
ncbi:argininosuccinate synthase [Balneolaceae bacterium ANBcel3]|nr:argininosuccinate synthase [Balneolaceae bacterium ANBcel3]